MSSGSPSVASPKMTLNFYGWTATAAAACLNCSIIESFDCREGISCAVHVYEGDKKEVHSARHPPWPL